MIKKYKYDIEEFKLITCMADFFKGVDGLSYDMNRLHASPLDVYMSEGNCYKLLLYMQNRVDRYSPQKKSWDAKCQYDWIERSPMVNNKGVPDDEVWLVLSNLTEEGMA